MTPCAQCPLRASGSFRPVDLATLGRIAALKEDEVTLAAGTFLIAEGQTDAGIHTLLDGWALRLRTLPDGRRQVLGVLLPGALIGLQQALLGATGGHAVQALTRIRACVFRGDVVPRVHAHDPQLALDLTTLAAAEAADADAALLTTGQRNATERLCALMLDVARRSMPAERETADGIFWPLTQRIMADAVGMSLVHTHRTLRDLARRDLCRLEPGRRLHIPDLGRLARAANVPWPPAPIARPLV